MLKKLFKSLKGLRIMNISILSNLFTKVENHYHAPVVNVLDKETALQMAKELAPKINIGNDGFHMFDYVETQDNPPTTETPNP
jgi:hypothetical protein